MEYIKKLMTEAELSQYEKLESALEPLYKMCNTLNHELSCEASKLLCKIINEMNSMKDVVLLRRKGKLVFDDENDCYYTDESFSTLFTGIGYFSDQCQSFYRDNGTVDELCYFVNGKIVKYYFKRNCIPYITDDNWYILPDKTMGEKSAVIFNLGCNEHKAFMTGVDYPFALTGRIAELISRRLKDAGHKGITAYKIEVNPHV